MKHFVWLPFVLGTYLYGQTPTNGLVAHYPFSGNANDASGKGNHGIVQRAELTRDRFGKLNSAYHFLDGARIRIPNSPSLQLDKAYTFSIWANLHTFEGRDNDKGGMSPNGIHALFAKGCDREGGLLGTLSTVQKPRLSLGQGAWRGGLLYFFDCQLHQWHHIAFVYDGEHLLSYLDGRLVAQCSAIFNKPSTANQKDLVIGGMTCWPYFFNGDLDEFRLYNRALSEAEIKAIYTAEKGSL